MSRPASVRPLTPSAPPPLRHGDRMNRAEFERRYEAMPHVKKAELIEGVVHMPAPVRLEHHVTPHGHIIAWLGHYQAYTPGTVTGPGATVRLDDDNEYQPDALLMIRKGGHARVSEDDYVEGGPELVAEISASSERADLREKFEVYRRHGVREYVVWRVKKPAIDWFVLRKTKFKQIPQPADGIQMSEVFAWLWLDVAAMLKDDMARVFQVLNQGIATPEHAEFVKSLQEPKA